MALLDGSLDVRFFHGIEVGQDVYVEAIVDKVYHEDKVVVDKVVEERKSYRSPPQRAFLGNMSAPSFRGSYLFWVIVVMCNWWN